MSRYRKITTICCAAVFALGLAACGGGSDDGLTAAEEDALRQQVADAEKKADDAAAAQKKAEDDKAAAEKKVTDAEEAAEKAAMAEMIATAAKLYDGIGMPMGDANSPAANDRAAAYNNADTPAGSTADTLILVTIGNDTGTPTPVVLSEDKKTMVAANHGWEGKRYTAKGGYEAMVYSDVGDPTLGNKFGAGDDKVYTLVDGELTPANADNTSGNFVPNRVALPGVTRTAGTETFELPDPNTNNEQDITVPGSYHGVSGTYICDTGDGRSAACSASVSGKGFMLTGAWTFEPADPNARVMSNPDTAYASYGWWIHKGEDGYTASAFVDYKGTGTAVDNIATLQGTATYMGGAAGKYALSSSTGGTNDAGHFTAMATLEADFTDNMISGTIDNFMGADNMPRDWSVELKEATIADQGAISRSDENDTVWTIGETAAAASGEWKGQLHDKGKDGVPMTAVGTFYADYGTAGKMVGAFGANQ